MNILLDIDGVLIRDHTLLDHVKNNAVKYVTKKLPSMKRHQKINNLLYKAYGHTALGLSEEFGIDTSDFDNFVYNRYLLAHLSEYLMTSETFKKDSVTLRSMCDNGAKITLFSNAPLVWTEPIREAIDLRIGNTYENLKPKIETYLKFGCEEQFVFVDDKINNLVPTILLENWTPVHYCPGNNEETRFLKTIGNLTELRNMRL